METASKRQKRVFLPVIALLVGDTVCVALAYCLVTTLTTPKHLLYLAHLRHHILYGSVSILMWYCAAIRQCLYLPRRSDDLLPQLAAVTKAVLTALMLSVFLLVLLDRSKIDRPIIVGLGVTVLTALLFFRAFVRLSLWGLRLRGFNTQNVLIIGATETSVHVAEVILTHGQYGLHIIGFLEEDGEKAHLLGDCGLTYLGPISRLEQLLTDRVIDDVYVALPTHLFYDTIAQIAHLCEGVGVPVRLVVESLPLANSNSHLWQLADIPLISRPAVRSFQARQLTRRMANWIVASLLIVVLAPVFLMIAVAIRLDSDGPILVSRPRVGPKGPFRLLSFRCSPASAGEEPLRLTRVGIHLRHYNLDELPHLFNIWWGQMTLASLKPSVGPIEDEIIGPSRSVAV